MEIRQFWFAYPDYKERDDEPEWVLKNMDFRVRTGEFVILCGTSGCGKTTLLRCMKPQIAPEGTRRGQMTQLGASEIGFVFQNPENQIVTDTVRHELAFGLENMGLPTQVIRQRVAETALFFGIDEWIDRSVYEISGGEKQLLNLASVIAMRPKLLLLDEPTAQLDPVARKNFLEILVRVNRELGIAVCISEHNLEEVLPLADRICYMEDGNIAYEGNPSAFAEYSGTSGNVYAEAVPAAIRLCHGWRRATGVGGTDAGSEMQVPLTVRDGMEWAGKHKEWMKCVCTEEETKEEGTGKVCLKAENLWFCYQKREPFVLRGLDLTIAWSEVHMVLGGNGSGKTTMLSVLAKRVFAQRGKIRLGRDAKGKKVIPRIGLVPQNPRAMFLRDTVAEELADAYPSEEKAAEAAERFHLQEIRKRHPYDLSGGQQQRLALALVLAGEPELLLLDEPTKGLDPFARKELGVFLQEYAAMGNAVVCVTHDVEFAAQFGQRCSMLFEGEILVSAKCREFFRENAFFTTDAARILRGVLPDAVCCEDVEFVVD